MSQDPAVRELIDRTQITETIYMYGYAVDHWQFDLLKTVYADDATFVVDTLDKRYPHREYQGLDRIVELLHEYRHDLLWAHHLLSVYKIEIDGDKAHAITYHTSHEIAAATPNATTIAVGRYDDWLGRVDDGWRVTRKEFHLGWVEHRAVELDSAVDGFLSESTKGLR